MTETFIGIDPDSNGAAAIIRPAARSQMESLSFVAPGEVDLAWLSEWIKCWVERPYEARVCVERQRLVFIPGSRVAVRASVALAKIEYAIRGLLAGMNIPMESVPPNSWKKAFVHGKEPMLPVAARLFPSVTFTGNAKKKEGQATALMLAEWGRRCSEGAPK